MNSFKHGSSMADEVKLKNWAAEVAKKSIKPLDRESYPIITRKRSEEDILFFKTHQFKRRNFS